MFVVVVRERERREKRERVNEEVPEPDLGIRQIGCITVFLPPVPRAITRFGTYSYVPFALFCACLFGKSHPTGSCAARKYTTNSSENTIRAVLGSSELVSPRTMAASHISGHRQTPHLSPRKIHRRPRPLDGPSPTLHNTIPDHIPFHVSTTTTANPNYRLLPSHGSHILHSRQLRLALGWRTLPTHPRLHPTTRLRARPRARGRRGSPCPTRYARPIETSTRWSTNSIAPPDSPTTGSAPNTFSGSTNRSPCPCWRRRHSPTCST